MPSDAVSAPPSVTFGLIVIGDEVLNGTRTDKHLVHFRTALAARGHQLAWHWVLPDDQGILVEHLRFSMARTEPVFVCGGIGATPDDHTRACAALAAGVKIERHAEAKALIEGRFGDDAYPSRILMADLPAGCELIANPHNQIPGFSIRRHFFLPGFPEMAWPMAEDVLERCYPAAAQRMHELAIVVRGVPESRLVSLMQRLSAAFPAIKPFSLPHLGNDPHILLGVRGRADTDEAHRFLCELLLEEGIDFESCDSLDGDAARA